MKKPIAVLSIFLSFFYFANAFAYTDQASATYEVPVPANLKAYAHFKVRAPEVRSANGKRFVHYTLPAEIAGPDFPGITMVSDDYDSDHFNLEAPNATAACDRTTDTVCNIRYKDLSISRDQVREFLLRRSKSTSEFNMRLQVAEFFRQDPAGVLRYQNK
jgi:hypothetical protein